MGTVTTHTTRNNPFTILLHEAGRDDVALVGGKNAALGEMLRALVPHGIRVPGGFVVTVAAYQHFVESANLSRVIAHELEGLNTQNVADLAERGARIREAIQGAAFPAELEQEICDRYREMKGEYGRVVDVAVRSSATTEDLPGASFAGQMETFLHVVGESALLSAIKNCFASLFTDRAISYRSDRGFRHTDAALSVGVQRMVRSDLATSGVMFTIDTESGFDKVVLINGSYGLGEFIVQGSVIPDEWIVFKPALEKGVSGIIGRRVGEKATKMVYAGATTESVPVAESDRRRFCMTDEEIRELALWGVAIEKHFSERAGEYQPMDIEWAKDGETGELFIVQARPETVHATKEGNVYVEFRLLEKRGEPVVHGIAVGTRIATGPARVIPDAKDIHMFKRGEVLVTGTTDPDWEPVMKIAAAIVTDKGGRTSHAAIVSRELSIPCIVGARDATTFLKNGEQVTVDCSEGDDGFVYRGALQFEEVVHRLESVPETRTKVMLNIGSPDEALRHHRLPVKGVGLGRIEFIIAGHIKIHPNALINYARLVADTSDTRTREIVRMIDELTARYADKKQYYVDKLAEGIAKIGAAFWPHEVIIRFSDFKTNEYRTLIGGELFEPQESNPMLGWRGASRYYHENFRDAFGLECAALLKVRSEMGLQNIVPMVPFCRTPEEGRKVVSLMEEFGLSRTSDPSLKIYVMCEIPSNVIQADAFLDIFDGMSIGSNDLTQLTLGLDRDAGGLAYIGNENNEAVRQLIEQAIGACRRRNKYVGICGQAPSDYPDFAAFLVRLGIESISLNPDTVIKTLSVIARAERGRGGKTNSILYRMWNNQ
ncbi:MAG: phosphoenolpyruvate synthase [bacterium]|nr:phosphoenolpyruvate synthase [bacterium]